MNFVNKAIKIVWPQTRIPHCVLDISRRCNISCRACYNIPSAKFKPLAVIEKELDIIQKTQKITSVLVVGGEPLLHPKIFEIIKMIHERGLFVEMSTNGVLFNEKVAQSLAKSGLNLCSFHVESEQKRPDLTNNIKEERAKLRLEKSNICQKYHLDSGLMLTAFKDNPDEINECLDEFLMSKNLKYFVITSYIDSKRLGKLRGDIEQGIKSDNNSVRSSINSYNMEELTQIIAPYFNNQAFNYIPSTKSSTDARWLSYRFVSAINKKSVFNHTIRPSYFEYIFLKGYQILFKKNVWYLPQSSSGVKFYLFLNGLFGNFTNFLFLGRNLLKTFIMKTLIITTEVEIEDHKVILCASCVDAQVKNGKLVPTCIVDNIQ